MREVTMDKSRLVEKVSTNRAQHERTYTAALQAWRGVVQAALLRAASEIDEGGEPQTFFALPKPESHLEAYDTVLEMLSWEEQNTVKLDRASFEQYVLDRWHWSGEFTANAMNYLGEHGEMASMRR